MQSKAFVKFYTDEEAGPDEHPNSMIYKCIEFNVDFPFCVYGYWSTTENKWSIAIDTNLPKQNEDLHIGDMPILNVWLNDARLH